MFALGCLVLPAVIYETLRLVITKEKWQARNSLLHFCIILVLTNTICSLMACYVFHHPDVLSGLDSNLSFTLKYLALSLVVSIAALYFELKYLQKMTLVLSLPSITPARRDKLLRILGIILAVVFLLAYSIRLTGNDFWGDELFSVMLADGTLSDLLSMTAADVHPPLYYIVLFVVCKVFGSNPISYQAVSFFFYFAIIILCLFPIWKRFGAKVAIPLILLSSLTGIGFRFAIEVRMYSMSMFFILATFVSLYDVIKTEKISSFAWFCGLSICAAYTHYYALLTVVLIYLCLIVYAIKTRGAFLNKVLISSVLALVSYLPWMAIVFNTVQRTLDNFWIKSLPTVSESFNYLFEGKFSGLLLALAVVTGLVYLAKATNLLALKPQHGKRIVVNESGFHPSKEAVWFLIGIVAITGTLAIGIVVSYIFTPILQLKYLACVAPIAWLLLSYACSRIPLSSLWCTILCLIVIASGFATLPEKIQKEQNFSESSANVLEKTQNLGVKPHIYTNVQHFEWTLGDYYYPGIKYTKVSSPNLEYSTDQDNWLFDSL